MKKRPYRSSSVKSLDLPKLNSALSEGRVILGIDVAKTHFVGALCDGEGKVHRTIRWEHPTETGVLMALLDTLGTSRIEVALESTGTYGDALVQRLLQVGISVFEVHTKHTRDAHELFDGVPSQHDGKCAAIIAHLHAQGKSHRRRVMNEDERKARALLDTRMLYFGQFESHRGRLEARLARYWPEACSSDLALDGVAFLTLLQTYSTPQAVAKHSEEAYALLLKASHGRLAPEKANALINSAAGSLGVVAIAEEETALRLLVQEMLRCRNELRRLEKQINSHCRRMPDVAAMAEVVGPLAAATLLSVLGKPEDYDSAGAWLKAAGLNLTEHSSGRDPRNDKTFVPVAISKRGSPEARRLLYLAALRQSKNDPVIAWWLEQKKKRDGGKAMPGVVAVMRKLMRAIWHIGRSAADAAELSGEAKAEKMQQAHFQAHRLFAVSVGLPEAREQAA